MRQRSFPLAFAFTAAALFYIIAGFSGYTFHREVGAYWGHSTQGPVVWEIVLGAVFAGLAAYCWRYAFRSAQPGIRSN